MIRRPCLGCGEPVPRSWCDDCKPAETKDRESRGYGTAWQKLSKRARRIQPWCSDCHTTIDLTVDHTAEAWARYDAGKPIRLDDVDVVCRSCNSRRGPGRGRPPRTVSPPDGKAQSRSQYVDGMR